MSKTTSRMATRDSYTEEDIHAAIDDVKSKRRSVTGAAKHYKIPKTTLRDKLSGKAPIPKKMGPQTFLTEAEENVLVNHIISAQRRCLPVNKDTVLSLVNSLLSDERHLMEINRDRPYQFGRAGTFIPGEKWYNLFLKRHPILVPRMTEGLSANRRNVSQQVIQQWFSDIRGYLGDTECLDILMEAKRNFNIDETGVQFSPKISKVLAEKGAKNVFYATSAKEKERITVLANIGADGALPPPLIIYPNARIPMNVFNAFPPSLAAIGKSESGYINLEVLYEYLTNAFDSWLSSKNIQRPVIVWSDKHESRIQYHLVKKLADLKIILILIPPNTTHFMQPLDVGLFGPLKKAWEKCVKTFRIQNPSEYVTKELFAGLFLPVYTECMSEEKIQNSFRRCGLHPFNSEAPDYSKLTGLEEHSGNTTVFEGVIHDGLVDRSTQVLPVLKLNVRTQTSLGITKYEDVVKQFGAGAHLVMLSKGCDDMVLTGKQFDAFRFFKREEWFHYTTEQNRPSVATNEEQLNVEPEVVLTPNITPNITPNTSMSTTPLSLHKVPRSAISPALLNHSWFPSPKKPVGKVRTVTQELHSTSVVTSDEVVELLSLIRTNKKKLEAEKEERKKKREEAAALKASKASCSRVPGVKRKILCSTSAKKKTKTIRQPSPVLTSSSDSEVSESDMVDNPETSDDDTDTEKLQDEIDSYASKRPNPFLSSKPSASTTCDRPSPIMPHETPQICSWVACKFKDYGKETYRVFYGKVISIQSTEGEEPFYTVQFLREKFDLNSNSPKFYWPNQDELSDMGVEEIVCVREPKQINIGKHRVGGYTFEEEIVAASNAHFKIK